MHAEAHRCWCASRARSGPIEDWPGSTDVRAELQTMLRQLAVAAWQTVQGILLVLVPAASMINLSSSAEHLYFFVDERGVPHFSNVPVDPRYELMEGLLIGRAESRVEHPPVEEARVPAWPSSGEEANEMSEEVPQDDTEVPPDMSSK